MRLGKIVAFALVATMAVVVSASGATAAKGTKAAGTPIVIGATVDLTKGMAPFDAPALAAAQIEIEKINAAGGVMGHPLQLKFLNTQLDPQQTKQDAAKLVGQGVDIGWVTCDVDYSTPSIQVFLQAKLLTVSPCIGTDEMGPSRFGSAGELASRSATPPRTRARRWPSTRTAVAGSRPRSSPTTCSATSRTTARRSRTASRSSAARSSRRSPSSRATRRSTTSSAA